MGLSLGSVKLPQNISPNLYIHVPSKLRRLCHTQSHLSQPLLYVLCQVFRKSLGSNMCQVRIGFVVRTLGYRGHHVGGNGTVPLKPLIRHIKFLRPYMHACMHASPNSHSYKWCERVPCFVVHCLGSSRSTVGDINCFY